MPSVHLTPKYAIKPDVSYKEYKMHKYVYNLGVVKIPRIVSYNEEEKTMKMQRINGSSVSDIYGESIDDVPPHIRAQISDIMVKLTYHNIEYPDITGYNFIADKDETMWVVDFEHASYNDKITDEFILDTCKKVSKWNLDFM